MNHVLTLENLEKSYGKRKVLQGFSMHVPKNSIYGFIGINGAGKTTTFSIISGFLRQKSGTIHAEGKISVLPQDAKFYKGRSIDSQLKLMGYLSGITAKNIQTEIDHVLALVNLSDIKKSKPEKLSHGMSKRIAIAQSILGKPDILLLDEPTSGLDPQNAYDMKKVIKQLSTEMTVVVSSHILSEIAEICDTIGIIHDGKMKFEGPISDITKSQSSITYYLSQSVEMSLFEKFKALTSIHFDDTSNILNISFNHDHVSIEEVNAKITSILSDNSIGFKEIKLGESLEDSFLKLLK